MIATDVDTRLAVYAQGKRTKVLTKESGEQLKTLLGELGLKLDITPLTENDKTSKGEYIAVHTPQQMFGFVVSK